MNTVFLFLVLITGLSSFGEARDVKAWKDANGYHVFFSEEGIGIHVNNEDQAGFFLEETGGDEFQIIAREAIRSLILIRPGIESRESARTFTYTKPKIEVKEGPR